VTGALLGWLTFGPLVTVVTFLVGSAVGATWWLVATGPDHQLTRGTWQAGWLAGAACVAVPAISQAVSGVLAFWLVVLAAATSRTGVRAVGVLRRRLLAGDAPRSSARTEPPAPAGDEAATAVRRYVDTRVTREQVRAMDTDELCRCWRVSYLSLVAARRAHELAEVLRVRQLYLDELHRRHPTALEAWFAAGGRAASGPERFLRGPGDGRAA
jgi:hypothetical protein